MKRNRILFLFVFVLLGSLLAGCTGAPIASSWPEVSADKTNAYLADASFIYAINLQTGNLAWKYPEKAENNKFFYSHPAVLDDGQLVVGDYAKQLISLNIQDGKEKWAYTDANDRYVGSPLVVNNLIVVPNADHSVYAVDTTGKEKWTFPTGEPVWARPVSDGKNIFTASMDRNLYALDMNGNKVWSANLGAAVVYSLLLSEDKSTLYAGTLQNEMIAVDAASGKINWRFTAGGNIWARPVQYKDSIFFGDQSGKIYALSTKNGSKLWEMDGGSPVVGGGAVMENGVAFPTENSTVVAVDFAGKKLWNQPVNGKLYSNLVFTGQQLLVPVTTGENALLLVALNTSGSQVWAFTQPK